MSKIYLKEMIKAKATNVKLTSWIRLCSFQLRVNLRTEKHAYKMYVFGLPSITSMLFNCVVSHIFAITDKRLFRYVSLDSGLSFLGKVLANLIILIKYSSVLAISIRKKLISVSQTQSNNNSQKFTILFFK